MHSPAVALSWEFSRRAVWYFAGTVALMIAFPIGIAGLILLAEGQLPPGHSQREIGMHTAFIANCVLLFSMLSLYAQADRDFVFPKRLFALPVETGRMVAWRMLPALVYTAGAYVVTVVAYRLLFDVEWPLWGPAMYLVLIVAWVIALGWTLQDFRWWKLVAAAVVAAGLIFGLVLCHHPDGLWKRERMWTEVSAVQLLSMLTGTGLAYATAVGAVTRLRRGDARPLPRWQEWQEPPLRLTSKLGATPGTFRSATAAQLWLDWQQKGLLFPAAIAAVMLFVLAIGWFAMPRGELLVMLIVLAQGQPVLGFLTGIDLGETGQVRQSAVCSSFRGTRPLSDTQLAHSLLKTGALSVLAGLVVAFAILVLAVGMIAATDGSELVVKTLNNRDIVDRVSPTSLVHIALTVLAAWTMLTGTACLTMTGRRWLVLVPVVGFVALMLLSVMLSATLQPRIQQTIAHAMPAALGLTFLGGSLLLYLLALRKRLLTFRFVGGALGVGLVLLAVLAWYASLLAELEYGHLVLLAGLAALPLAPVAAAPLAISWNRHR